ncbi:MAG: MarR family transcriptional regulator [Gammaproteobacteria bacterium]|nr:MarR family transcriptional regulator [Gammaproteobacteria bacterium]
MHDDQLAADVMNLFRELSKRMRHRVLTQLEELDVTPQMAWALHHLGDGIPMGTLAGRLSCDASYVTGIADGLEHRGLAERRSDPSDRRVKQLVLTDEGKRVRDMVKGRLFEEPPLLGYLDDEELAMLKRILEKMLGSNEHEAHEAPG